MAILKIKDETGKFVDIPAIQGPPGKDGAIQYEAGENIKIEDNVISAEVPICPIYVYKINVSLKNPKSNQGLTPDDKISNIITTMYRNGDMNGVILLQSKDTLSAMLHLNQESDYTIQRKHWSYRFKGAIVGGYNSTIGVIRMSVSLNVSGEWSDDNVFTCTSLNVTNGYDYDLANFATKDDITNAITTALEGEY